MNDDLDKLREVFLAEDIDEEDRADNLARISEFEQSLRENKEMIAWQSHDVTKRIIKLIRETYVDQALQLAKNRTLSVEQRTSLWAKQDAMLWLLELADTKPAEALQEIHSQIQAALSRDIR